MMKIMLLLAFGSSLSTVSAAPIPLHRWDVNHSTIAFRVPIAGGLSEVEGKFTDFSIDAIFDEENPERSSVKAVIHVSSVDTGIAERDTDLRSVAFFDVAKYPDITFQSVKIEKSATGFAAEGNLTMHGVTKRIVLPFTLTGSKEDAKDHAIVAGFSARVELNRRDYGVSWEHQAIPDFVGDLIQVEIHLITKKNPISPVATL